MQIAVEKVFTQSNINVRFVTDSHKGSNFYNPVLNRIGLGK